MFSSASESSPDTAAIVSSRCGDFAKYYASVQQLHSRVPQKSPLKWKGSVISARHQPITWRRLVVTRQDQPCAEKTEASTTADSGEP